MSTADTESQLHDILELLSQPFQSNEMSHRVDLCHQALAIVRREQDPDLWAQLKTKLANSLVQDSQNERESNLESAIHCYKRALEEHTRDASPEHWAVLQHNLGFAYQSRIGGERTENIKQAIVHYRQALLVHNRKTAPTNWAITQASLALALSESIGDGQAARLEQAIEYFDEVLEVYTRKIHPGSWAATQNNLGLVYSKRLEGERAENLEQAIRYFRQALQIYTRKDFAADWATTLYNIGNIYSERIRGKRDQNLEEAIDCYERALQVQSLQRARQRCAATQNNLATVYAGRIRGKRADNIEQAIRYYRLALQTRSYEALPKEWAETQNNLANSFFDRIQGERADNVELAIHHYRQALKVQTSAALPEQWATIQNNLGTVYAGRIQGDRADNLEQAIDHYRRALDVRTQEALSEQWATTQNNLAVAYSNRMEGERSDNLEQAIHHYQQALKVRTREALPEQWATVQNNLAAAYADRIEGERADNLEQAIHHYRQALTVRKRRALPVPWATTQNNLSAAYASRIRGRRPVNLKRAIYHGQQALEVRTREAFPADYRGMKRNLGGLYFAEEDWEQARASYAAAIAAGADLLAEAYTEAGRRAEVRETGQLYANAAFTLVRLRQFDEALITLDRGKTRLSNEAMATAAVDVATLPEEDRHAMVAARQVLRALGAQMNSSPDGSATHGDRELADAMREARADLNRIIERTRAVQPGFMPVGLDLPSLLALIPQGGALVAPLFTIKGGIIFVVPHGVTTLTEDNIVRLDVFTNTTLAAVLMGPADVPDVSGWLGAYAGQRTDPQNWSDTIETIGRYLWDHLMVAVHERLQAFGLASAAPVLLMPQGGLGLLPLHAAWRIESGKRRYFLDDYTISWEPGGYALSTSLRRLEEPSRGKRSLLAIINPTKDLPFTMVEGRTIMAMFTDPRPLVEDQATVEEVAIAAPTYTYLHCCCHGSYDWKDPMSSGLELAGGQRLTLARLIAQLNLTAVRLVTLSACETGLADIRQSPDEFLGLSAGFLQAGAPAVISTLWRVDDLSTMLLMERFYRGHLEEHLAPAAALRAAQRWLCDATAEEMDLTARWARVHRTIADPRLRKVAFDRMRYYPRHLGERPFAHPYHWAAFTLAGA